MLTFVENEVELNAAMKDGQTLRSHLESAERVSRQPIERLHRQCPAAMAYLWNWFLDLSLGRSGSGTGPNPLTYADIHAWCKLTGVRLLRFELAVIKAIDAVYLVTHRKSSHGD